MGSAWVTRHTKTTPFLMHTRDNFGKEKVRPASEEEFDLYCEVVALRSRLAEKERQ